MGKKLTHLSLFTGIGGIDLAAEAAGFITVCQCEWADYPARVLNKHWPEVPRFRDIRALTKEGFIEKTKQTEVTLISGGFPCQPFSSAGRQRGFSDERYLWPEMVRIVSELHPHWVLGENVAGFINMGLDKTVFDLEREGYAVQTFVYPACGVGAWHERTRTFIVAADVSHATCVRHSQPEECDKAGRKYVERRYSEEKEPKRNGMEPSTFGGCFLSDAHSIGRNSFKVSSESNEEKRKFLESFGADDKERKSNVGKSRTQSRLGGMAYGIPKEMDGHKIWSREPAGISRITEDSEYRAQRLKTLGNAVCPQQVYPILKCIADIENRACKNACVFGDSYV